MIYFSNYISTVFPKHQIFTSEFRQKTWSLHFEKYWNLWSCHIQWHWNALLPQRKYIKDKMKQDNRMFRQNGGITRYGLQKLTVRHVRLWRSERYSWLFFHIMFLSKAILGIHFCQRVASKDKFFEMNLFQYWLSNKLDLHTPVFHR